MVVDELNTRGKAVVTTVHFRPEGIHVCMHDTAYLVQKPRLFQNSEQQNLVNLDRAVQEGVVFQQARETPQGSALELSSSQACWQLTGNISEAYTG